VNDGPGGRAPRLNRGEPSERRGVTPAMRRTPEPRTARRTSNQAHFPWTSIAVVALLLTLAMLAWSWLIGTNAVGVALIEIPLLMLLTTPLFMRESRAETRFDLGGLLALGLIVRFAAAYYRFTHASDGATYHLIGTKLAESYRHFDFGADTGYPIPGTGGMRMITGLVEVFTNANSFATFLVFSWLGFFGCYLFYRAFVMAVPNADHHRYAILVMLWPTLVFWPSSIGKDCWLLFTLGIASYGAARVYLRRPGGYTLFVIGLVLGALVRPHMSLMLAIAFGVGLLVGRRTDRPGSITPSALGKVAGLVVLLALGGYLTTKTADLLNTQDINVDSALTLNATRTDQGGSSFSAANPQNPIGYVQSAVTVLFRPFPIEAHGMESLATSIEALGLLVLAILSWKRLKSIPRRIRPEPYVTVAIAYIFMFFFAFGTIGNFGILARERSMMMPYVFVLLSLTVLAPKAKPTTREAPVQARGPRPRPRTAR
jgi:hypothetical protein